MGERPGRYGGVDTAPSGWRAREAAPGGPLSTAAGSGRSGGPLSAAARVGRPGGLLSAAAGVGRPGGLVGSTLVVIQAVCLLLIQVVTPGEAIMCYQCDTDSGDIRCATEPPPPETCTGCLVPSEDGIGCELHGSYAYCMIVTAYDMNGTLISFTRSCSPISGAEVCVYGVDTERGNTKVKQCRSFCDRDNCNSARDVTPTGLLHALALFPALWFCAVCSHLLCGVSCLGNVVMSRAASLRTKQSHSCCEDNSKHTFSSLSGWASCQ